MTTMGQGQLAPCPHQRKTHRIQPSAPPALHKGIRAALGHFDQYGREAGRGSRYSAFWCHRLIWSSSFPQVTDRELLLRPQSHDLRLQGLQGTWVGLRFGGSTPPKVVRKRTGSRARGGVCYGFINRAGSRVTCGETPVRNTRRQRRARGAHQSQRSGMRRTPRAGDGTRARICQSFSSACSGPESLTTTALASLRCLESADRNFVAEQAPDVLSSAASGGSAGGGSSKEVANLPTRRGRPDGSRGWTVSATRKVAGPPGAVSAARKRWRTAGSNLTRSHLRRKARSCA
jgi:hypothetical protein